MKNLKPYLFAYCIQLTLCLTPMSAQISTSDISFGDLSARSIGPATMSGRVATINGVNSSPEIIYIGAASGGIWKSISAGASFQPIFDDYTQSIGDIEIDQMHPDTVWVGTGEPWVRNSVSVGDGIYVTTNGGKSWDHKGLKDTERIAKVIIHPTQSNIIYVAAQGHLWNDHPDRGVYKSIDFGNTWEKVLYIDERTGCADLDIDPSNPEVLYAAMWNHRRSPDFFESGGKTGGLFKTTDGGKTWNKVQNGIPQGVVGRIAVAFAPSNSSTIYATVEAEKKAERGLYKTTDGGLNWKLINTDFDITVRPFYFSRLVVDPSDENVVWKGGLNLIVSEDGGHRFRTASGSIHSDIHAVWVNPSNGKHVLAGTDGGVYRSLDRGYTFEHFKNLPLAQFYQISVDNEVPYNIYGGLQDNGSWYGPSRTKTGSIRNSDWKLSYYGDGFYSVRHLTDPDILYSESQGGSTVRHRKSDGQSKNIQPLPGDGEPEYRFNWNTPIHLSQHQPNRIYIGAQFLFKSDDQGDSWQKISPDLTTNDPLRQRQKKSGGISIDNSTAENNTTIYVIGESPVNEQIIWVGTDDGNVQVTSDGGKTWNNVLKNITGLPAGLWVSSVEPSRHDAQRAYITVDGHRSGDMNTYVYRTDDLGKTWKAINDAEVSGYAHVIKEDILSPDLLYLGTEFGLYISIDQGASWKAFNNGIPKKVAVHDIAIPTNEDGLVIGTHGRGVYIIDDIEPLRQLNEDMISKTLSFFQQEPFTVRLQAMGQPFAGDGHFAGSNPSGNAAIAYYLQKRHTFGKMSMDVYDADGVLVTSLPPGKSKGINMVPLPLRLAPPKSAPTNNRMALFGSAFPPSLTEGKYTVKVTKGKEEFVSEIVLKGDENSVYCAEARKAQLDAMMKLYNMTNELGHIYYALQDMHTQAEAALEANPKKAKDLMKFAEETKTMKESLVSLEGDFYVDEGSNIREEISTLYLNVSQYPGKPSDSQIKKIELLETRMAAVNRKFNDKVKMLEKINKSLGGQDSTPIHFKTFEEYMKD